MNLKNVLLASLLAAGTQVFAQPLNGTYTIGGTNPDYANIDTAAKALNSKGVSGPVIFNIRTGTYTTKQATINNVTGASATNRITFRSETGNAANVTISFAGTGTTNNFIFKLANASYITIRDLTLSNTGATYARNIEFTGTASNDSIVNCKLNAPTVTASSTSNAVIYSTSLTGANNVIKDNTIQGGSYGIYYFGSSTVANYSNNAVFTGNTISGFYVGGIYTQYTKNLRVLNNTLNTASTITTCYGIHVDDGDEKLQIIGNKISGLKTGYGIDIGSSDAAAANKGIIANNTVIMGNATGTSRGIFVDAISNQSIRNNTVRLTTSHATTGIAAYFALSTATEIGNEIYNNLFANTGGGYAMFVQDPSADNVYDYNNLYATGPKLVDRGTPAVDYANLTSWRAASGRDKNSISLEPGFTSPITLTINPAAANSWSLNGRGIHIPGNDKDIDGNPRVTNITLGVPDIGAYEFTPTATPPAAVAIPAAPAAGTTQVFTLGEDTVATIAWDATAPVPASVTVRQYTGTVPAGINAISATQMYFYTDISAPAGSYNFTNNTYYKEPWMGTTAAESALRLAKKEGSNPWVGYNPSISLADVERNFISTPNLGSFGQHTGIDVANNASVAQLTDPTGDFCAGTYPVKVRIANTGSNVLNSVQIGWAINGVPQTPVTYNTAIPVKGSAIVTLGNVAFTATPQNLKVWTTLPNNGIDPANADDTLETKLFSGLSGTYTVGGANPHFSTVVEAANALNARGVCGPVVFNIRDGNYTGQFELTGVKGVSAANRITFQSETNNASNVNINFAATDVANNYVAQLTNVSYVTFRALTFESMGTTYARAIVLTDSATSDSVINCVIKGPAVTASSINTALVYGTDIAGKDKNYFIGNTFLRGSSGLYYEGTSATILTEAVVDGNTFQNQYAYGAYFYYTKNLKFRNNTITGNSAITAYYGFRTYTSDGALEVIGNKINAASSGYGVYVNLADATEAVRGIVKNNTVVIGAGTTNDVWGLYIYNCNYQDVVNNSVSVIAGDSTASYAGYFYNSSASYEKNAYLNNALSNTGKGFAMLVYNPALNNQIDYNNLYTNGINLVRKSATTATNYPTLTAWRAFSGRDMNSISFDPGFTSTTNLVPNAGNAASWSLNGRGVHVAGNNKDINGNTRVVDKANGVPDIGAYEFTPTVQPPLATANPASPAAGTTQVFTFGEDTVATIAWAAAIAVPASISVTQYTGTLPAGINSISPTYMYFYTDIAAPAGTYSFTNNLYYKEPWAGTTAAESALRLAKKDGSNPWFGYNPAVSSTDIDRNIIVTPNLGTFGLHTGIDVANNASVSDLIEPVAAAYRCAGTYPVKVRVKNTGSNVLNTVKVDWTIDGVAQTQLSITAPIDIKKDTVVTLGNVTFSNGFKTIKAWPVSPNGGTDPVSMDDTVTVTLRDGLSGLFTIGGTNPDYANFTAAANALKQFGMCGPVTFNVRNGNYNEQIALNAVNGISAANRLTFQSESNNAANVDLNFASTGTANNYVLSLTDMPYVTLKAITITNNGTATYGRGLFIAGVASGDSVLNCIFNSPVATASTVNNSIVYANDITGSNFVFTGNTFNNGSYGMYMQGVSTTNLMGNPVFVNNTFSNQYAYATYLYYTSNMKFNFNTITTNSTSASYYGYRSNNGDGAIEVIGNKISGAAGGYGIYHYNSDATAGARGTVKNNVVTIGAGITNDARGMYIYNCSYQDVINNSVNIIAGDPANSWAGYFYNSSATYENNNYVNNALSNAAGGYAMYVYNPTYKNVIDYNNLYSKGGSVVDRGTPAVDYKSLEAWRAASGQDMHSISYDPGYMNPLDLHPDPANPASWSLNGRGMHIPNNNIDLDGLPRITQKADGVPDIGAYEFLPTSTPPLAKANPANPAPATKQFFTFGEDTVAMIQWNATTAIPSMPLEVRQYSGTKPLLFPGAEFMYFYTDIVAQNITYDYDAFIYYDDTWTGTIVNEPTIRMARKPGNAPWQAYNDNLSSVSTTGNIIKVTDATEFGQFTGSRDGEIFTAVITAAGSANICNGTTVTLNANTGTGYTYQWYLNGNIIPGATQSSYVASLAGDYKVVITNATNVTATSEKLTVTVIAAPTATVTPNGPTNICAGGSLQLNANPGSGFTYQWNLNNTPITGATSISYMVTAPGIYTVTVKNINCGTTSSPLNITQGPLDVQLGNDTAFCEGSQAFVLDAGYPGATYLWSNGATTQTITPSVAGTYWVKVDAGGNCTDEDTIQVDMSPLPKVNSITYVNSGNFYTFSPAGVQNAIEYLWIFDKNGTKTTFSGANPPAQEYIRNMAVTLIVFNPCGSDTVTLTKWATGVDDAAKGNTDINLYPNPARDYVTIDVQGDVYMKSITVINAVGQVVHRHTMTVVEKTAKLDVSQLASGHYIVHVETTDGIVNKPLNITR